MLVVMACVMIASWCMACIILKYVLVMKVSGGRECVGGTGCLCMAECVECMCVCVRVCVRVCGPVSP